jgi:predicted nucleotidyltransferase component of viral defense system
MTTHDELKRIAGREKVGLGIIEKDHAITAALEVLSGSKSSEHLTFKGGTAIKKMFYPEARFSEDLDFDCQGDIARELAKEIEKPLTNNVEGVQFTGVKHERSRADQGRRLSLQYNDSNGHPNSIKLDLTFREKPVMNARKMEVKNLYGISHVNIMTMDIREIMAEKARALLYTPRPRHLYDIWFLVMKGVKTTKNLLDHKLKLYHDEFQIRALETAVKNLARDWERDLRALLPAVPKFEEVSSDVLDVFSRL